MRSLLIVVGVAGCAGSAATPGSKPQHIDAEAPQLWVQVTGTGDPTIVFEAGEGDDSSVWAKTEADVRLPNGVRTVLYDRAGLGRSAASSAPYKIDDEASALKRALDRFGIKGPVVLVAHSYGGFVATLVAATDKRVIGMVLVDGFVKEQFDDAGASRLLANYTPQLDALDRSKPGVAQVMRPLIRAFPDTARRMRSVTFPASLPTIDIVSEHAARSAEDNAAMMRAHAAFAAASPVREQVVATDSGHYVMRDRPDLVVDAISRIVRAARSR